jgi:hypothetical protein
MVGNKKPAQVSKTWHRLVLKRDGDLRGFRDFPGLDAAGTNFLSLSATLG